ncbi:hypothetical protein POM88_033421 [Heracleum sosnowskyi]|uniref:NAC domain-containing protein n=1 Tax=Heracleum sosnowskyi TaxID=360622 RepID=A0AAD8I223_9APIA|nr:hypothetical protein POM88_033421 [Heracleum sosnowskyi]
MQYHYSCFYTCKTEMHHPRLQLWKEKPTKIVSSGTSETYQGYVENGWYFFMARDGECANGDGHWKATGDEKTEKRHKTNWIMHEFRVTACPSTYTCQDDTRLDDWVLCRIYREDDKYKRVPKKIQNENSAYKVYSPFEILSESKFGHNVEEFYSPIFEHGGILSLEYIVAS